MKTYLPKQSDFEQKTYLVDASGKTLGRLATKVAGILMGKGKRVFAYDQLSGDQVIVINAKKVYVSGKKKEDKIYNHYTGWAGGLKTYSFEELIVKKPEEIIMRAVKRMLPKNKLGREMLRRLRVFANPEHNMQAQKPIKIEVA